MSTATPPTSSNGAPAAPLVPTNTVTTASGLTVRTRIDPVLTVDDVVRQLCLNLKIEDPPSNFALRDDTDELVTNDNLRRKIRAKVNLKLVNAPSREAMETAEKLRLRDDPNTLKMTLFTLQKYIREEQFAQSFINCSGLSDLIDVIFGAHGNTLAYALTAMQNLMELDYGWSSLDDAFIFQVVQILSSPQSLINVCRPATAILKKMVEADPMSAPGLQMAGSSRGTSTLPPGSVYRYGFAIVFEQMRKGRGFLETVISRLGSADTGMAQYSMMLINSLLAHASDTRWEEFIAELERLNVRKAVVRLMSSHTIEDLTSCILDFQANFIRVIHRKKTTPVDLEAEPSHVVAVKAIWSSSQTPEQVDESGQPVKWRLLGFDSENIEEEFRDVGVLGLECLRKFIEADPDFPKISQEQLSRPLARRCPVAKASNEVVEILSEHWAIFAPGYSTSTTFQPFFLDFYKVHSLATHFFIRMWSESGASTDDFTRVAALVRSQAKVSLRMENVRPWHEVEHDFNECEYRTVRERQMKELEVEDDLLSKIPIRRVELNLINLRAKLYKESYEFVRQQRIQCLMQGAWFINALPQNSTASNQRRPNRPWRFIRLDPGMKYLHYVDSAMKFAVRSGLEDLPERIEVASISEIATGSCAAPPHVLRESDLPPTFPPMASPLSFSLLSAHEGSIADQIAPDQSRWADWTDGLNMLRRDGGHVSSKETAGFVQALTEIGLKIKLLDLSGEMVEIPSGLVAGPPPSNTDFFFSDLM
ncbi:ELMO/CED-12 family-domain-containing protein [Mycena amicta]|nr:ELMO/CED-12 family-domain-containing protein [Mycena amicta]